VPTWCGTAEGACLVVQNHAYCENAAGLVRFLLPVGREVGTTSEQRRKQAFQLRQRHQKSKGWQMHAWHSRSALKCARFGWRQRRDFFHFLRNMRNGHVRKTSRGGEAEDGERADHVDRNHMASMDCVFNTQRYQIIHTASRLEDCRWKNCKTARDKGSSHDQARSTSLVIRAAPRLTTGSRLENAAAAMSASAFSPFIVGGGRHRRHDNIANSDLAKDEVKSPLSASSLT
jgi:hypothetical protein